MTTLDDVVRRQLAAPTIDAVRTVATQLAETPDTVAILFYGSNLRTGSTEGVLDFYVLTAGPPERGIWPTVSYREFDGEDDRAEDDQAKDDRAKDDRAKDDQAGERLRAKIATMRLATFASAAAAASLDTTIWTRFVQPSALVWSRDAAAENDVAEAIAAATRSAARFAAALGPEAAPAHDYWRALFRQTYAAEFRVERRGREDQILGHDPDRYAALLPLAWRADGIDFARDGERLRPAISPSQRRMLLRAWGLRRRAGKPINIARLIRAAFTFEGAARYGAWKIERHTSIPVTLSPWAERHPILAAPGVLWRVWRARPAS